MQQALGDRADVGVGQEGKGNHDPVDEGAAGKNLRRSAQKGSDRPPSRRAVKNLPSNLYKSIRINC